EPAAADLLDDDARELVADHVGLPGLHHVVADTPSGPLLLVLARVTGGRRPYLHVHHVSAPSVFAAHHLAVRRAIAADLGGPLLVDARFRWAAELPRVRRLPDDSLKLHKPCDDLPTDQIDNLYSELVLLPFPQLPPSAGPVGQRIAA